MRQTVHCHYSQIGKEKSQKFLNFELFKEWIFKTDQISYVGWVVLGEDAQQGSQLEPPLILGDSLTVEEKV